MKESFISQHSFWSKQKSMMQIEKLVTLSQQIIKNNSNYWIIYLKQLKKIIEIRPKTLI